MACLNLKNQIYLQTYDPNNPQLIRIESSVATLSPNSRKYDYFYIQFSNDTSFKHFPISKIVPPDILEKIKEQKVYLLLDNGLEYFLSTVESIYNDIIIKEGIPPTQIIFLSAVPTMIETVKATAKKYNKEEIILEWFSLFEHTGQDAILKRNNMPVLEKKKKYGKKKFLNLNRRWRIHRPLMTILLHNFNLLESGYISMARSDDGMDWNRAIHRLKHMYSDDKTILKIINDNQEKIKSLPEMYLDTKDLVTNRAIHEESINEYYKETYFSLISETTYHENIPFFSEKVFKAMAMGHPFLLVTAPRSLQYLKKLGYKTFHPLIDETYDTIDDPGKRMMAIVKEVERLCKLDKAQLKEWLAKIRPIANDNYTRLKNKRFLSKMMNYKHLFKAP